jgi:hypothetical protein
MGVIACAVRDWLDAPQQGMIPCLPIPPAQKSDTKIPKMSLGWLSRGLAGVPHLFQRQRVPYGVERGFSTAESDVKANQEDKKGVRTSRVFPYEHVISSEGRDFNSSSILRRISRFARNDSMATFFCETLY